MRLRYCGSVVGLVATQEPCTLFLCLTIYRSSLRNRTRHLVVVLVACTYSARGGNSYILSLSLETEDS